MTMMAFRLSRLFRLWLLASLKTLPDCLYFVPLFLKLFVSASLSFSFLEIFLTIVQGCFWWFLISRLGVVSLVLFLGLVRLFFFLVFSSSKFHEFLGLALLVVLCYFFDFLFPYPALHISMGPSRSFVLRIGSDSTEASSSGRTSGESDNLAVVVH